MAKFKLRDGEQTIGEFDVSLVDRVKREPERARLVVTNERLVVITGGISEREAFFAGVWGLAVEFVTGRTATRIAFEIPRERFASVEADDDVAIFRSDGEGYGQTSFAIARDPDTAATWHERLTSVWPARAR